MDNCIKIEKLTKKRKDFLLDIPDFELPQGFATAFIGENGAGKTTLLDIMAGIDLAYKGKVTYYGKYDLPTEEVYESIGYSASTSIFMPHWRITDVSNVCGLLFDRFNKTEFSELCAQMSLSSSKRVSELSDGNKMRLMIAAIFARDTSMLLMDEPASPLDPVMRDNLCDMIRGYISNGDGRKSVCFSTHNISDMENATDYAVIVSDGRIVEKGFVEDLKEKYIIVKGENSCADSAKSILYSFSRSSYGFEGICLAENLNRLAGMDVKTEAPTLHQISVAVMKANRSDKL